MKSSFINELAMCVSLNSLSTFGFQLFEREARAQAFVRSILMLISNYIVTDIVFRCSFVSMNDSERVYLFDVVVLVFVCGR